jgi:drug/metabolite transporter (DMT)-like permease
MSEKGQAILFAVLTAFFWGVYGPALGFARSGARPPSPDYWSPFKPYLFIGLAYLVWGCIGGAIIMKAVFNDSFSFSGSHQAAAKWGFLAGSLGAFGALTLTFAVVNAGRAGSGPALVMPIVFGGAVTVTAITSYFLMRGRPGLHVEWLPLGIGMLMVLEGIILIATYSPHVPPGGGKPAAQAPATPATTTSPGHS